MSGNKNIIKDVYRVSLLNTYEICPYAYKLAVIDGISQAPKFFSVFGTLGHDLHEKYFKQEIFEWELKDLFIEGYKSLPVKAPPNNYVDLDKKYLDLGSQYFYDFCCYYKNREMRWDQFEILQIEEEERYFIDDYEFSSTPDFYYRRKVGDKWLYGIGDHKSSKPYKGDDKKKKLRQLYLYCIPFKIKYGFYPDELLFNHFIYQRFDFNKFDEKQLNKTKKWAIDTIKKIKNDNEFKATCPGEFWANYVCGYGDICEYKASV